MKNVGMLLMIALFTHTTFSAFAQKDAAAKSTLEKVSRKYDSFSTITTDFSVTYQTANKKSTHESGKLLLDKKNNRYHITSNTQNLISDGKTLWTVMKTEKEVEVSSVSNSSATITPQNIFTFFKKGFKYVQTGNEKAGSTTLNVIELSPEDHQSNYFKIKLRIVPASKLIHDVLIFDKGGSRISYTLKNQQANKALPASLFNFNKANYSGYEVVDLR